MSKNSNNSNQEYMSAGEFAAKAGVTVRTVQYYDQKGLLKPSFKGTRNRRLYTPDDLDKLYRILCYKYMGMSLSEIADRLDRSENTASISENLHSRVIEAEKAISDQMKRYAVLRNLEDYTNNKENCIDWEEYAGIIDYIDTKWDMIWQLNQAFEKGCELPDSSGFRSEELKNYYKIIAAGIDLMNQNIPPDDPRAIELIREYFMLKETEGNESADASYDLVYLDPELMNFNIAGMADIWKAFKEYLKEASDNYLNKRKNEYKT